MNLLLARTFILLTQFIYLIPFSKSNPIKKIIVQEQLIALHREDVRSGRFEPVLFDTSVGKSWNEFPSTSTLDITTINEVECQVSLNINIPTHKNNKNGGGSMDSLTLCLFKENSNGSYNEIFDQEGTIQIFGESIQPLSLIESTQSVIGFVSNRLYSLVSGHIVDKYFYGIVRIYDKHKGFHRHYFIEPIQNGGFYSKHFKKCMEKTTPNVNAIIFDYISHEDSTTDDDEDCAIYNKRIRRNADNNRTTTWAGKRNKRSKKNLNGDNDDIVNSLTMKPLNGESSLFDLSRQEAHICSLCIWIQPHFAEKLSFGTQNLQVGLAQLINLIRFTNKIFRSIDFNDDGVGDNFGIRIKSIIMQDEVQFEGNPLKSRDNETDSSGKGKDRKKRAATKQAYSKEIYQINTTKTMVKINEYINTKFASEECCIKLGFIYQNMAPFLSSTNKRGACSKTHSLALISGFLHSHQVSQFDIYRGMVHAIGHLFGAGHDTIVKSECDSITSAAGSGFLNPFIMHRINAQLNVGLRPGSMTLSKCSKMAVTKFLTSTAADCLLKVKKQPLCGNGILEDGEECDCGSLPQCHTSSTNECGESDTILGCKLIKHAYKRHS